MKKKAAYTKECSASLVETTLNNVQIVNNYNLPSKEALLQTTFWVRKNKFKEPKILNDLNLTDDFMQINNESFVLRNERFASERIILLGQRSLIKYMCSSEFLIMDGTFHSTLAMVLQETIRY